MIDVCVMVAWYVQPFDELLIMPHQAQKGYEFHVSVGQSELSHSFQVLFTGSHTLSGDK